MSELQTPLLDGLERLGIAGGEALAERLLAYLDELVAWNRAYNLTAVRDPADMLSRHLLDSLAIGPWVRGEEVLDVGSGAGLPGIPLALAWPQRRTTLLDSNGKKVRFLRHVIRSLKLERVQAVQCRVEDYRSPEAVDTVTARALASVDALVTLCGDLLSPGGRILAMRGQREPVALPPGFEVVESPQLRIPGLEAQRHLLVIEKT